MAGRIGRDIAAPAMLIDAAIKLTSRDPTGGAFISLGNSTSLPVAPSSSLIVHTEDGFFKGFRFLIFLLPLVVQTGLITLQ